MSMNLSAYVEKKNMETGNWELVTEKPISTRLKYVIDDYDTYRRIAFEKLSDGLKTKYKTDDGIQYGTFYHTTLDELESHINSSLTEQFSKVNMIVKALGCHRMYSDDGEELEYYGVDDDNAKDKLTFPINKELVEDLQHACNSIRKIGQRETLDLIFNEHIGYEGEYRVIFVLS